MLHVNLEEIPNKLRRPPVHDFLIQKHITTINLSQLKNKNR